MSAREIHLTKNGDAETATFSVDTVPEKVAGPGEVVVKITTAPVNPADIFSIMGVYPGFRPKSLPAVPGLEGTGFVKSVGEGVSKLRVGQRVVPFLGAGDKHTVAGNGSWQDEVVISADACFPVPDDVSDDAAAQFVVNPFTAWLMIKELQVPSGEWIIQTAAGSVLGRQLIQFAKHLGLRTINIVRRPEQAAELKALGADEVICSTTEDVVARAREITGGKGAWGGVDAVAGDSTAQVTSSVRDGGLVLLYGAMAGLEYKGNVVDALFRGVRVHGFWIAQWANAAGLARTHDLAAELWPLFSSGIVAPLVGEKFPAEKVAEAVKASVAAARGGKVLLTFA